MFQRWETEQKDFKEASNSPEIMHRLDDVTYNSRYVKGGYLILR